MRHAVKKSKRKQIIKAAFDYLSSKTLEHQIILHFNQDNKLIIHDLTENNSSEHVEFSLNIFLDIKDSLKNKKVYTAHNHPSNMKEPSMSDYIAASYFNSLLRLNDICFMEEFIVTSTSITSYSAPTQEIFPYYEELILDEEMPRIDGVRSINFSGDKEQFELLIHQKMISGYEVIRDDNVIYFAEHFTFDNLFELTSSIQKVLFVGVPHYRSKNNWQRITDIENVFGSIEFYSTANQNILIPLKKQLIL